MLFTSDRAFVQRQILRHYEPGLSRPEVKQRVGRGLFRATTPEEVTPAVTRLREWIGRFSEVRHGDPDLFASITAGSR
jgi:hypothetical protein